MKRLLFALLVLFTFSSGVHAWGPIMAGGGVEAPTTFCYDATHTTANSGTAVRLCEDMESSTSCFTGGDSYCRVTWTISGAPDDTATAVDGTHSIAIDGASAATEYIEYDTGAVSTTLGAFAKIKIVALPTTSGHIRQFIGIGDTSPRVYAELNNNGTVTIYGSSRATATSQAVTAGNTYYFWIWYDDSSGSNDGIAYVCFSTTNTRPADPSTATDYCSYQTGHNVTNDVDRARFTNGYSTTFNSYIIDNIVVSTSEIGSNP